MDCRAASAGQAGEEGDLGGAAGGAGPRRGRALDPVRDRSVISFFLLYCEDCGVG